MNLKYFGKSLLHNCSKVWVGKIYSYAHQTCIYLKNTVKQQYFEIIIFLFYYILVETDIFAVFYDE